MGNPLFCEWPGKIGLIILLYMVLNFLNVTSGDILNIIKVKNINAYYFQIPMLGYNGRGRENRQITLPNILF